MWIRMNLYLDATDADPDSNQIVWIRNYRCCNESIPSIGTLEVVVTWLGQKGCYLLHGTSSL